MPKQPVVSSTCQQPQKQQQQSQQQAKTTQLDILRSQVQEDHITIRNRMVLEMYIFI